jgi:hypothetical protein
MDDKELDTNVAPYLITRRWVKDVYKEYWNGSVENSPFWMSRVRGELPSQSDSSLFSLVWIEAASRPRDEEVDHGIDVAGPRADETVCYVSNGVVLDFKVWNAPNPRGEVLEFLRKWKPRLRAVRVDESGIGYGMLQHPQEHLKGCGVHAVNFGSAARETERFSNLKAEMYWALADKLRDGKISGLLDPETQSTGLCAL